MRPSEEPKRRSRPSSPLRVRDRTRVASGFEPRSPGSRSSVSVLDREELLAEDIAALEGVSISSDSSNSNLNPRRFPYSVKQQCWDKAQKIKRPKRSKGKTQIGGAKTHSETLYFGSWWAAQVASVTTIITFYLTLRPDMLANF
ncbi:hypothetical protein FNV43_RR20419 [Rhamnella rubrinervis]|uniref:Uncharacterized protein n=1 Tax=Rhamnella rubrinervis TaxID=2594499 RepID=A0A8K0DYQ8_9ROSA|nr:hypothetical protein FNV43_RR20419 [Rhamnella rubrinervis]